MASQINGTPMSTLSNKRSWKIMLFPGDLSYTVKEGYCHLLKIDAILEETRLINAKPVHTSKLLPG